MTTFSGISFKKYIWASLSCLCCLFLAGIFLFGQTALASHSHEHGHNEDEPVHHSCEVCILAVSEDSYVDFALELKNDAGDTAFLWTDYDYSKISEPTLVPSLKYKLKSIHPPPSLNLRPNTARAPPFHI